MAATIMVRELPYTLTKVAEKSVGAVSTVSQILSNLEKTAKKSGRETPLLVGASKKQPVSRIQWAYNQGLRHFGENYAQEFESKARYLHNHTNCTDVKWHFLGRLQGNKTKLLASIPGLWMVETLDSVKNAQRLNNAWGLSDRTEQRLKVLIQVNTSCEETKQGCSIEACADLVQYVLEDCNRLEFRGLMTVGRLGHDCTQQGPNPDFISLVETASRLKKQLSVTQPLELSMGMSADYEHAVEMGSTCVRVGTALFGPRETN